MITIILFYFIFFLIYFSFSIPSLIVLFHLFFILYLVLVFFIAIYFVFLIIFKIDFFFQFHHSILGWLRILLHDFFVFALYGIISILLPTSRVSKINLIWLRFFLAFFFKLFFFQFYLSTLGYWTLSLVIFFTFLSIWSRSHISGHGLIKLTRINSSFFDIF